MSYRAAKTNYVRPHAKTSYIRPLFCLNEKENVHKAFDDDISTLKNRELANKELDSYSNSYSVEDIEDIKEKHVQRLNSTHSKLYAEINKIHTWSALMETECKQKDKKVDELNQTVESQRKVIIGLQMENENLSMKLDKEIQEQISILEKFYATKESFSTLKKKIEDVQGQFDACCKVKKTIDASSEKSTKVVEDLTKKMNALSVQYSENILILNNSLKSEKNSNLILKEIFEQQTLSFEKEHKSLCKLVENFQKEITNYSQDLESERNKVLSLQHEKNDLLQKIAELEKSEEIYLQKQKDVENQLRFLEESKIETEKKYSQESIKVNNLTEQIQEIEELINKQKKDFEEKYLTSRTTITTLENSLTELKQKLEEYESEKEILSRSLETTKNEKSSLEKEISTIQKENKELHDKLTIDAKISDESISLLMKEKNEITRSLNLSKEDLQATILEKERLIKVCFESDKKLSEMTEEYETAAQKITEIEKFRVDYNECLVKIKKQEDALLSLSEELRIKEQCIEKMNILEQNYNSAVEKINEMEKVIKLKTELFQEKEEQVLNLTEILKENNVKLEKLEYENLEIKDCLVKEKESVKICLDCEMLKKEIADLDHLRATLKDTEKELNKQKQQTLNVTKWLNETEENYNQMRIKKETEIINCNDIIESLQHDLRILRVEVSEVEKLRHENEKLHLTIEEINLQNDGNIQRLKAEIEALKVKENVPLLNSVSVESKRIVTATPNEKTEVNIDCTPSKKSGVNIDCTPSKKTGVNIDCTPNEKTEKCIQQETKHREIMEADSSDEVTIIQEERTHKPTMYKKFSKEIDGKVVFKQLHQSTPLSRLEKKKRAWDSESSGSECLGIIYDNSAKKVSGFTPQAKSPAKFRTPVNLISARKFPLSQEKKRDILEITAVKTPKMDQSNLCLVRKSTPQNQKSEKNNSVNNVDFLCSENSIKEKNFPTTPCGKQATEMKRTPTISTDRKFFKTPLNEREYAKIKQEQMKKKEYKPQLQNRWF